MQIQNQKKWGMTGAEMKSSAVHPRLERGNRSAGGEVGDRVPRAAVADAVSADVTVEREQARGEGRRRLRSRLGVKR